MNLMRLLICYALSLLLFIACNQGRHVLADPAHQLEREAVRTRELKITSIKEEATRLIGRPYKLGSSGPKAFDCSGFTTRVFKTVKIKLPRTASDQAQLGNAIKLQSAKVGDLLFFGSRSIDHVSVVTRVKSGKIYMTHSTSSNGVVEQVFQESDYWRKRFKLAKRVII